MSSATVATLPRTVARWCGLALVAAVLVELIAEAVVAAAWDRRPYSYLDDYVNFLGNPFVSEFRGFLISSPLWWLMSIAWIVSGGQPARPDRAEVTDGVNCVSCGNAVRILPSMIRHGSIHADHHIFG